MSWDPIAIHRAITRGAIDPSCWKPAMGRIAAAGGAIGAALIGSKQAADPLALRLSPAELMDRYIKEAVTSVIDTGEVSRAIDPAAEIHQRHGREGRLQSCAARCRQLGGRKADQCHPGRPAHDRRTRWFGDTHPLGRRNSLTLRPPRCRPTKAPRVFGVDFNDGCRVALPEAKHAAPDGGVYPWRRSDRGVAAHRAFRRQQTESRALHAYRCRAWPSANTGTIQTGGTRLPVS